MTIDHPKYTIVNNTYCTSVLLDDHVDLHSNNHNCTDGIGIDDYVNYNIFIKFLLDGIFRVSICILGLIANGVSIPVLFSDKMKNLFNITLAILALFDTIYVLCDLLESLILVHYNLNICTKIPAYVIIQIKLFPTIHTIKGTAMMTSIYITIIIAIERYFAVAKPLNTYSGYFEIFDNELKNALLYIFPTSLFSILFCAPSFFASSVITNKPCVIASNTTRNTG